MKLRKFINLHNTPSLTGVIEIHIDGITHSCFARVESYINDIVFLKVGYIPTCRIIYEVEKMEEEIRRYMRWLVENENKLTDDECVEYLTKIKGFTNYTVQ